jgi:hypothetical protein
LHFFPVDHLDILVAQSSLDIPLDETFIFAASQTFQNVEFCGVQVLLLEAPQKIFEIFHRSMPNPVTKDLTFKVRVDPGGQWTVDFRLSSFGIFRKKEKNLRPRSAVGFFPLFQLLGGLLVATFELVVTGTFNHRQTQHPTRMAGSSNQEPKTRNRKRGTENEKVTVTDGDLWIWARFPFFLQFLVIFFLFVSPNIFGLPVAVVVLEAKDFPHESLKYVGRSANHTVNVLQRINGR